MFAEDAKKVTKKSKSKQKGIGDEDLFGNTDDIFGDLPTSSTKPKGGTGKGKKGKKKAGAKTPAKKEEKNTGAAEETPPTEGRRVPLL